MYRRRVLLAAGVGAVAALAGCGGRGDTRDIPVTVVNATNAGTDVTVTITDAHTGESVVSYDGHLNGGDSHTETIHASMPPSTYHVVAQAGQRRVSDTVGGSGLHRISLNVLRGSIEVHTA